MSTLVEQNKKKKQKKINGVSESQKNGRSWLVFLLLIPTNVPNAIRTLVSPGGGGVFFLKLWG